MTNFDAVVVTHNTRRQALSCLDSILAAGPEQVVLVDCGSVDGTADAVRNRHPSVDVVELDNVGFGRGVNTGVERTSEELVYVSNADTTIGDVGLDGLASVMEATDVALVGPRVVYPDGRPQASARRLPTFLQAVMHALLGLWWPTNPWTRAYRQLDADPDEPREVDWISGCAFMLRRTAFNQVAGFDPGYWMYVEDVDLAYRLREAGWRVQYEPSSTVIHEVGSSSRQHRRRLVRAHARSISRFHKRAYSSGAGILARPFVKLGLALWSGWVLLWGLLVGRRRSTTGE